MKNCVKLDLKDCMLNRPNMGKRTENLPNISSSFDFVNKAPSRKSPPPSSELPKLNKPPWGLNRASTVFIMADDIPRGEALSCNTVVSCTSGVVPVRCKRDWISDYVYTVPGTTLDLQPTFTLFLLIWTLSSLKAIEFFCSGAM